MADSVKIKITGDDSGFRKTLSGLGSVAKSSLGAIVTGAGAAAAAIGAVSVKSLTLAGDLEQNVGGAEAVFGELGNSISKMSVPMQKYNKETKSVEKSTASLEAVSKDAYKNMGLSQSDYLATVNKMGALMKGSGMEAQQALNLSSEAMQRAADVASIMGVDIGWAMESIAGAAKGNFTMMDNLGVAMNDTNLQAYALEKGIKKSTQAMTQQEKIGLAMQMFLEKTSYAAGNYAKENETLAGSLATAKAAMSNFLAGSGDFEAVFESVGRVAKVSGRMIDEIITRLTDELTHNSDRIGNALGTAFSEGAKKAPKLIDAGFSIVKSLLDSLTDNADAIGSGVQQTVFSALDGLSLSLPSFTEASVALINGLIPDDPSQLANSIVTFVDSAVASAGTLLTDIDWDRLGGTITGSISAAIINSAPDLLNIFSNIFSSDYLQKTSEFNEAFTAAFDGINWDDLGRRYAESFKNSFKSSFAGKSLEIPMSAFSKMFDTAKNINVSEFIDNIKSKISEKINSTDWKTVGENIGAKIRTSISDAINNIKDIGDSFMEKLSYAFKNPEQVSAAIEQMIADAISSLGHMAVQAKQLGENLVKNITSSITGKAGEVASGIKTAISNAISTAMGVASNAIKLGSDLISGIVKGLIPGAGQISSQLSSTISSAIATAKAMASQAISIGKALIDGIIKGIKEKANAAIEAAKNVVSSIISGGNEEGEIRSPSRKTTKTGQFLGEGYAVGLTNSIAGAVSAAENLVSETSAVIQSGTEGLISDMQTTISNAVGVVPSPGTGVTRFRVDTLFGGDPTKQSEYYSQFLKDEYDKEIDAVIEAQKNALIAYDDAVKNGVYSDILWHQLEENMFPKTDDSIMAFFDQRIKLLDTMLGLEVIAEEEYYQKLEQYMGEYLKNGTEQWYEYTQKVMEHKSEVAAEAMSENIEQTKEFAEFEKDILGKAHDMTLFEEMDFYRARMQRYEGYIQEVLANTELMEKDKKELIEEYESQITDDLYEYAEVYVDAYSEAAEKIAEKEKELKDDIMASRDDMISTLADYGTLFFQYDLPTIDIGGIEHTPTITELSDISKQNEFKREYKRLMDKVMSREGFAEGFFSELEGLSVPDAVDFMRALLGADDKGFKKFMSDWAEGQALNKSIAESFYDPASVQENEELKEMRKAFEEEFGELPEGFLEIGSKSAESFGNGFLERLKNVIDDAKGMISTTFGGAFFPQLSFSGAPGSSGSYTVNYYLQPSNGESTRQQLTATENAATLNKARGGYY